MGTINAVADDLLDLIITNVAAPNIGDAGGLLPSAAPNNYHISLHTVALTGATANQGVNEAAYSGYARVPVARAIAQWTIATQEALNDAAITYIVSADGPETEVHFGMGFATSGATKIDFEGDLTADLVVNIGVTPEFAPNALSVAMS